MSTINNIIVEDSGPYLKGRGVGREVDQRKYKRLLELQQLARENGYPDKDIYERLSTEQVLFILGVVQQFRLDNQKASSNRLDLDCTEKRVVDEAKEEGKTCGC